VTFESGVHGLGCDVEFLGDFGSGYFGESLAEPVSIIQLVRAIEALLFAVASYFDVVFVQGCQNELPVAAKFCGDCRRCCLFVSAA
jgi:hypothetical protein